jgi:hypothetical protein
MEVDRGRVGVVNAVMRCTGCGEPLPVNRAWARINGQPYCGRDCYEKAMRDKGLTRVRG